MIFLFLLFILLSVSRIFSWLVVLLLYQVCLVVDFARHDFYYPAEYRLRHFFVETRYFVFVPVFIALEGNTFDLV